MLAGARRAAIGLAVVPTNSVTGRYLLGVGCPVFDQRASDTRRADQRQPTLRATQPCPVEPGHAVSRRRRTPLRRPGESRDPPFSNSAADKWVPAKAGPLHKALVEWKR